MSSQEMKPNFSILEAEKCHASLAIDACCRLNRILENLRGVHPCGEGKDISPQSLMDYSTQTAAGIASIHRFIDELEELLMPSEFHVKKEDIGYHVDEKKKSSKARSK
jgi:hypothetical protein